MTLIKQLTQLRNSLLSPFLLLSLILFLFAQDKKIRKNLSKNIVESPDGQSYENQ